MLAVLILFLASPGFAPAQNAVHGIKTNLPPRDEIWYGGLFQESNSNVKHLRGGAYVKTSELQISADEIDFDSDTNWAYAHGHVHMEHFVTGDKIEADHGEYNLRTEEGKFFVVSGTSPAKIMTSPGVLTTTNPFYFQAKYADRFKDRYILHQGFLTDCKIPKPWWIMQAPVFDIVPGNRAIARNAVLRIKRIPVFYLPYFYRPLGRNPRESGFLTPSIGHSTLYGWIYGDGYYWAINKSYDMTGIVEQFSQRGPSFNYDFRGRPNDVSEFNFRIYDVDDHGTPQAVGPPIKEGGLESELTGSTSIWGFAGRVDYNYLSSFIFRQEFAYTFATSIYNEIDSAAFLQRRYNSDAFTLDFVMQRNQTYEAVTAINEPQNEVIVQKLPSVEFTGRDQQIASRISPLWFSLDSSASLMNRTEPTGLENSTGSPSEIAHTGEVGRVDVAPHIYTNWKLAGFSLEPGVTVEATDYTNSYSVNQTCYGSISPCAGYSTASPTPDTTVLLANANFLRHDADFTADLRTPSLQRIFKPAPWLHLGTKLKHVIEGEARYEYVTGIDELQKIIRFDSTDIISDTNQLTLSVTNRLYKKDKNGAVSELLSWQVQQARYFDPTFGGAAVAGQRTVVAATEDLTAYPFIDGLRSYSPIVSTLLLSPYSFFNVQWRSEYDPLLHKSILNSYNATFRYSKFFTSVGETAINTDPLLFPQSNQISFGGGYGSYNRKGWNFGASELYDLDLHRGVFEYIQGSYNTDCCGFSAQYRRINFGIRDENQYLFSFSLANLGTFGSLQKQERIF